MDYSGRDYVQEYLDWIEKTIGEARFIRTESPSMVPTIRPSGVGESSLRQLYAEWSRVRHFQDAMRVRTKLFIS